MHCQRIHCPLTTLIEMGSLLLVTTDQNGTVLISVVGRGVYTIATLLLYCFVNFIFLKNMSTTICLKNLVNPKYNISAS